MEPSGITKAMMIRYTGSRAEQVVNGTTKIVISRSYIGIVGKTIEPLIKPLGYDWKVGIGLVASFAAREVFVGTLATIYSVGSAGEGENIETIKTKMANETYADGTKVFTLASQTTCLGAVNSLTIL